MGIDLKISSSEVRFTYHLTYRTSIFLPSVLFRKISPNVKDSVQFQFYQFNHDHETKVLGLLMILSEALNPIVPLETHVTT